LDDSTPTGRAVLAWSGDGFADALPMRLTGGLNALARRDALPELAACYPPNPAPTDAALAAALAKGLCDDRLLDWLASAPQTNEVARSGVLMPGLLVIAQMTGLPLALFELGASAGLNLRLDDYGYVLGGQRFGRADAPLTLAPRWDGPPPLAAPLKVAARRGVDLNPLDLGDPATSERLLAFVWPEQAERVQRLEAAIAAFIADPVALDRGDAADWVESVVAPRDGVATVVFHSIAHQYFPATTQARIAAHMARMGAAATAAAPLAWLRFELDDASAGAPPTLRLTLWPGGEYLLARTHPHGAVVHWLGAGNPA
ncbi:MAG TPA: DUF2332 domain-containing protein, partial [Polymorphobacter sp.]|nr:DUF2332 domain-containing protein [Polymorphobacter sp.]